MVPLAEPGINKEETPLLPGLAGRLYVWYPGISGQSTAKALYWWCLSKPCPMTNALLPGASMPVYRLIPEIIFPPVQHAEANGLLAIGGDLQPQRLIAAYAQGIFPWFNANDPLLWWFPTPRLVLYPDELHVPRRLLQRMRQQPFQLSCDKAFTEVIGCCASSRQQTGGDTWISASMQQAYTTLHQLGYAHSVECWRDGELAGGLYGVRLDRVFFGESMFTRYSDASKVAFVTLVEYLVQQGVKLIDCQMTTAHLQRFGAREIDGGVFSQHLKDWIQTTQADGPWHYEKT